MDDATIWNRIIGAYRAKLEQEAGAEYFRQLRPGFPGPATPAVAAAYRMAGPAVVDVRATTLSIMKAVYVSERDAGKTSGCGARDWINGFLCQMGDTPLSEVEYAGLGLGDPAVTAARSVRDGFDREWDADPRLHLEFGCKENYVAFRRAEVSGRATILGHQRTGTPTLTAAAQRETRQGVIEAAIAEYENSHWREGSWNAATLIENINSALGASAEPHLTQEEIQEYDFKAPQKS